MSKIIEATKKLIDGDKAALALVDKIADDLYKDFFDFEDIKCVNAHKELILGYNVYYGLSKIKVAAKDGKASTKYELIVHGIFRPLDGARVMDKHIMSLVKEEIVSRN